MFRILSTALLGLLCAACGGGIDSYESAMEAQLDIMEEMSDVLEDVTDAESAQAAVNEIGALGDRLAQVAAQIPGLPQPDIEELQELAQEHMERSQDVQRRASSEMMKLGEYPELGEAFSRAMTRGM